MNSGKGVVMDFKRVAMSVGFLLALGASCLAAELRNGGFEETYIRAANTPEIEAMKKMEWKFSSPLVWPKEWEGSAGVSVVTFRVAQDHPHSGKNCILLWGQAGSSGYLSTRVKGLKKGIYKLSFWGRGKGRATLMLGGLHIVLNAEMSTPWALHSGIFRNTTAAKERALTIQAQKKEVFFDDVTIEECDVLGAAVVEESGRMRRKGRWLAPEAKPDAEIYRKNVREVLRLIPELETCVKADLIPENVELIRLLEEKTKELKKVTVAPSLAQANQAAAYSEIAKRLLMELEFEDVKE